MIYVQSIGPAYSSKDQATGKETRLVTVKFIEENRPTTNVELDTSSNFIAAQLGGNIQLGLSGTRTHSQPILEEHAKLFKVHTKFGGTSDKVNESWLKGHINRTLRSFSSMPNQDNVRPSNIGGRPTFFITRIEESPKDDIDQRVSDEVLLSTEEGRQMFALMQSRRTMVTGKTRTQQGERGTRFADGSEQYEGNYTQPSTSVTSDKMPLEAQMATVG